MIKDAAIVMVLGMGTVFLVLLALLGLMTLGGRLALRYARRPPDATPAGSGDGATPAATADAAPQEPVAVAVAAARQHHARRERGVKA